MIFESVKMNAFTVAVKYFQYFQEFLGVKHVVDNRKIVWLSIELQGPFLFMGWSSWVNADAYL